MHFELEAKSSHKLRSYIVTWIEFVKKTQLSTTKFCNEVVHVHMYVCMHVILPP